MLGSAPRSHPSPWSTPGRSWTQRCAPGAASSPLRVQTVQQHQVFHVKLAPGHLLMWSLPQHGILRVAEPCRGGNSPIQPQSGSAGHCQTDVDQNCSKACLYWHTAILLVQYSKSRVNNYFCLYSHFSHTYRGSVDAELDKPGCSLDAKNLQTVMEGDKDKGKKQLR